MKKLLCQTEADKMTLALGMCRDAADIGEMR